MKIAVFHNLPSGGAKRSLYEWVKRLSIQNKVDLYGYSSMSEEYLDIRPYCSSVTYFWKNNIRSTRFNVFLKIFLLMKVVYISKLAANKIDSMKYDAVFVHHDTYIQSPLLLFFLKTKSIYYCQEPFRRVYGERVIRKSRLVDFMKDLALVVSDQFLKLLDKLSVSSSDTVLANSYYSSMQIYNAYKVNADVVYVGVDTDQFYFMKEIEKENMVLSVGRLDPSKGHDDAIRIISNVDTKYRPILRIMSDTSNLEYKQYLEKLAIDSDVEIIIETIPERDLCLTYNRSKILLSMQKNEPLGLVALEAMACGVPVIGVAEGGIKETVVDNVTGYVCPRDIILIAGKVRELLIDDEKRGVFSLNSIECVENKWTWMVSTKMIEDKLAS